MDKMDVHSAIITKAMALPIAEAQKVLIFVAGLDAGLKLNLQNEEKDDAVPAKQQIA